MAIKPQDNTAFMREVEEEVRKDRAIEFWRRWGKWIAALVVAALIAFGGWMYWQSREAASREAEGEALNQLLLDLDQGNRADVDTRIAALAASDSPGYRAAALMTRAALALQAGDTAAATATYAEIVGDADLAQPYRDLALIRQTAIEFGAIPPQQVIDRLAGLAQPGNPWFGSAGEMTAIALMMLDRDAEAGRMFAAIANDERAPGTLRTRAAQMAGSLGVDAVGDEPVDVEADPARAAAAQPAAAPGNETAAATAAEETSE